MIDRIQAAILIQEVILERFKQERDFSQLVCNVEYDHRFEIYFIKLVRPNPVVYHAVKPVGPTPIGSEIPDLTVELQLVRLQPYKTEHCVSFDEISPVLGITDDQDRKYALGMFVDELISHWKMNLFLTGKSSCFVLKQNPLISS